MSKQSSRKQKERSCTGLQHGPCKWGVRSFFRTRGSCTDRAREEAVQHGSQHGPCPLVSVARVFSTGRVREACALISSVARGVLINTDRVRYLACTGLGWLCTGRVLGSARGVRLDTGRVHSARVSRFSTGQVWFCTGRAIFSLLWGRNPNLSQYSGLFWFENLNWIN